MAVLVGFGDGVRMWVVDLSLSASYDASPEEVFAMITDATFQEQVCERIRPRSYDVAVREAGTDTVVRVWWETRSVDVPAVAKRFVHQPLVVAQTKIWHPAHSDGSREGDVEGEVADAPIKLTGRTRISADGRRTTQLFDLHVTATVPVVGKRLERIAVDAARARLEKKFEVAWSWLSGSI